MFKNKNKFLGKRGQLLKNWDFYFPLVCLLHLRLMHFGLTPVSCHLSLWFLLLSSSQGIMVMVNFFCFCNMSLFLYIWKDYEIKRPTKPKWTVWSHSWMSRLVKHSAFQTSVKHFPVIHSFSNYNNVYEVNWHFSPHLYLHFYVAFSDWETHALNHLWWHLQISCFVQPTI